jgi:glutamine synthetase
MVALTDNMDLKLAALSDALAEPEAGDALTAALHYHDKVVKAMEELRAVVDEAEPLVPAELWPVPVYADMLFKV